MMSIFKLFGKANPALSLQDDREVARLNIGAWKKRSMEWAVQIAPTRPDIRVTDIAQEILEWVAFASIAEAEELSARYDAKHAVAKDAAK